MTSLPAARFIGFPGSTPVGNLLMHQAASTRARARRQCAHPGRTNDLRRFLKPDIR